MSTTTDKPTDTPTDTPTDVPTDKPASGDTMTLWLKTGGIVAMVLGVLVFLYFLAFHLGAAVLSYQKFGSFLWAILDFFFPYFYYPYYAFVVSKEPAPVPETTVMMGGAVRKTAARKTAARRGLFRRL